MCYGMNTAFTAGNTKVLQIKYIQCTIYLFVSLVMTPQLMEDGSEFLINEDEEGWIVSIDNSVVIFMSILSGVLQTKYGPMKVIDYVHFPLQFIY